MNRLLLIFCLFTCLLTPLTSSPTYDFSDNTILVVLKPEISYPNSSLDPSFFGDLETTQIENISLIHSEKALQAIKLRGSKYHAIYKLTLPTHDKANILKNIEILKQIDGILHATPDHYYTPAIVPNDEYFEFMWGLDSPHGIKAPQAWDLATGSQNIRVGVMDTGIASHPDLDANLTTGWDFVNNNATSTGDEWGHGTNVAGVIGAVGNNEIGVVGVNWDITIVPLKVAWYPYSIQESYIISAINFATNTWGGNEQISILNSSLNFYTQIPSYAQLAAIESYPGLFVWAAGNGTYNDIGIDLDTFTGIESFALSNIIAVGAIQVDGQKSSFSNYSSSGEYVHVYAPGSNIASTSANNDYEPQSGTSLATPFVSGVAALLLSVNPAFTAEQLKMLIISGADPLTITTPAGEQIVNRLNAFRSLQLVSGHSLLIINPRTYNFEDLLVNQTSQNKTFTLSIIGDSPLTIDSITLTGADAGDFLLDVSGLPWTLNTDETQTFTVTFTPSSLGEKTASIVITSDTDESPHIIYITGTGVNGQTIPYTQNFDNGVALSDIGWKGSLSSGNSGIIENSGLDSSYGLVLSVTTNSSQYVYTPPFMAITADAFLAFAYRIVRVTNNNWSSPTAYTMTAQDIVYIETSTTGGAGPYAVLHQIVNANHTPSTAFALCEVPLSVYNAQNINIRFRAVEPYSGVSWAFVLDNIIVQESGTAEPPQNLVATAGNNFAVLSWQEPLSTIPLVYKIYRDGVAIASIFSALSYQDGTARNGNQYTYTVSAVYIGGVEAETDPVTVLLYDIRPPMGLQATVFEGMTVVLTWNPPISIDGLLHYIIYRRLAGGSPDFIPISEPISETYIDSDLVDDITHYYRATAVYLTGESTFSNIASARPTADADEVVVTTGTALGGNYPNPFNPETVISFTMVCEDKVNLDIYNMRGQRIRSLISGVYSVGEHRVVWNGCNERGRPVGSGVYFYRMATSGYTSVRKMVLLK